MSFILQSELDRPYILKLCQDIRLIKQSKVDWTVEHVLRFASLIKIEDSIKDVITNWEIDGNKLFDVQYLNANLDCLITQRNYMPFYKLFYVVNAILEVTEGRDREPQKQPQDFMNCASAEEAELDIPEETITKLIEQLQRMNNMSVIELGSVQLSRLLKSVHLLEESESVLKWAVDGFSLLCIIGNEHYNQTYKNYYSNQNLKLLSRISHIFTHIYYYQHHQKMQQEAAQQLHPVDQFDVEFNDLNFPGKSFHSSQFGTSEPGEDDAEPLRNSEYGTSVRGSQAEFRNSEFAESVRGSMVKSEAGSYIEGSVRGSVMESVRGSIMQPVRGSVMESVRGSVMESVRGSMRQSIRESMQEGNSTHDSSNRGNSTPNQDSNYLSPKAAEKHPRNGKGEDNSIIEMLMQASLRLPFNLLNLEPLQKIKISSIPYPFNLYKAPTMSKKDTLNSNSSTDILTVGDSSSQRSESLYDMILEDQEIREFKVFNLTGAKFGRSPENDFSYPDELSISGRHAQIVFKDESYYIRDLGSKTGTFVYISEKKPLVLSDEQLVQLSYEVEFKVIIIKNDINQGIIKFQFKKPENQPPYRAILKNNNTVRFGKAENSHIKLTNQSISSYHAQIKFQEGKFIMYDCNTRTGTWLRLSSKGVRSADRKLSKMDIIRISSKKTFLVQDMTEGVEFLSCCELGKGRFDDC